LDPHAFAFEAARTVEFHRIILSGQCPFVVRRRGETPCLRLAEVGADRGPGHIVPDPAVSASVGAVVAEIVGRPARLRIFALKAPGNAAAAGPQVPGWPGALLDEVALADGARVTRSRRLAELYGLRILPPPMRVSLDQVAIDVGPHAPFPQARRTADP